MGEKEFYNAFYADEWSALQNSNFLILDSRRIMEFLIRHGKPDAHSDILSIGCGEANIETHMAATVGRILAVDISDEAISKARKKADQGNISNISFSVQDVEKMSFSPASFDAIWAIGILHHMSDESIRDLLLRCKGWLRPNGLMISFDPSSRRFVGLFKRFFRKHYDKCHSKDERWLNINNLCKLYRVADFDVIVVRPIEYFLVPLGYCFPRISRAIVNAAGKLDSVFTRIPGINLFASTFGIVARNRTSGM